MRPSARTARILPVLFSFSLVFTPGAHAGVVVQLTDGKTPASGVPALDDAGDWVFANAATNGFGGNPELFWQVVRWDAATGAGSAITSHLDGVSWVAPSQGAGAVSVSDDGQWIAFASPSDPLGTNMDGSLELFVQQPDGSGLAQLTNEPAPNAGSVLALALSGSADRIVFLATTDPLGNNPSRDEALFVIDRDGGNLAKLPVAGGDIGKFGISDDGQRIAFACDADLTGGNSEGGFEIFTIFADGTGLAQRTSAGTADANEPALSGDGTRIAFQSRADLTGGNPSGNNQVFVVNWGGTGLTQITFADSSAWRPSITDDGATVVYYDDHAGTTQNTDGNDEIWKAAANGTGHTALTDTLAPIRNSNPVVSGSGGRIAFRSLGGALPGGTNPDGGVEWYAMDGSGSGLVQLTAHENIGFAGDKAAADLTGNGTRVAFIADGDVWRMETDGTGAFQVTSLGSYAANPGITDDGRTIVFHSAADPVGQNPNGEIQVFAVQADGTGMRQLTPPQAFSCGVASHPTVAKSGSVVAFTSCNNYTGQNWDLSTEVFAVGLDGTGMIQLTRIDDSFYKMNRIDDAGTWVVLQSPSNFDHLNPNGVVQVLRVRTDGTGRQRITTDTTYGGSEPDVSGSGGRIVYSSAADPFGTNADHSLEIFVYEPATFTTRQLTFATEGGSRYPRITADGTWVYFKSNAPFFESNPDDAYDAYRVPASGGAVERVGALRLRGADLGEESWRTYLHQIAVDADGDTAAFTGPGDRTGGNADADRELYLVDQAAVPGICESTQSPTVVSWDPDPLFLRYDVIRGDVADLSFGVGDTVDLSGSVCLADDLPDIDTAGYEDPMDPAPSQAFYYLRRGAEGVDVPPQSWGEGTGGKERTGAACGP